MDATLRAAFRKTRYRVLAGQGELLLRVDQHGPKLAALLREAGAGCAALLTAFNPGGHRSAPFRNRRAQRRLHDELARLGCAVLTGFNEDPRGRWPTEPSFLAFGLPIAHAREIAARYGQIAFLWSAAAGTPLLIATAGQGRRHRLQLRQAVMSQDHAYSPEPGLE